MPHKQSVAVYRNSTFCFILPGDTQASKRASEVQVHGCIPVVLGPPYSTLPFSSHVNYSSFAVFVEVSDTSPWVTTPEHRRQVAEWTLDVPPASVRMHKVRKLGDVPALLRSLGAKDVARRQAALAHYSHSFVYSTRFSGGSGGEQGATDVLLKWMVEAAHAGGGA
jgi:hypothetical protein